MCFVFVFSVTKRIPVYVCVCVCVRACVCAYVLIYPKTPTVFAQLHRNVFFNLVNKHIPLSLSLSLSPSVSLC